MCVCFFFFSPSFVCVDMLSVLHSSVCQCLCVFLFGGWYEGGGIWIKSFSCVSDEQELKIVSCNSHDTYCLSECIDIYSHVSIVLCYVCSVFPLYAESELPCSSFTTTSYVYIVGCVCFDES